MGEPYVSFQLAVQVLTVERLCFFLPGFASVDICRLIIA